MLESGKLSHETQDEKEDEMFFAESLRQPQVAPFPLFLLLPSEQLLLKICEAKS